MAKYKLPDSSPVFHVNVVTFVNIIEAYGLIVHDTICPVLLSIVGDNTEQYIETKNLSAAGLPLNLGFKHEVSFRHSD